MKEQKQSFLERLTGARVIPENREDMRGDEEEKNLEQESWETGIAHNELSDTDEHEEEEDSVDEDVEEEGVDDEPGIPIDMYETGGELIIQSMIAGVTPENLHIAITRETVTISGKRIAPEGISEDQYVDRELYWGKFKREIALPYEIDTDGAEAVEKYGLLIIRLPRLNMRKTQELKVKSID